MNPRPPLFGALAVANLLLVVVVARATGVVLNTTDSQPLGLYRFVDQPLERGALVGVCLPPEAKKIALERGYVNGSGRCSGSTLLIKRVLGVGGDRVDVDGELRVNGRPVAHSHLLARDASGRPLEPAESTVLAPAELWLFSGKSALSFDSRYYGPVTREAIEGVMAPLWVLGS